MYVHLRIPNYGTVPFGNFALFVMQGSRTIYGSDLGISTRLSTRLDARVLSVQNTKEKKTGATDVHQYHRCELCLVSTEQCL